MEDEAKQYAGTLVDLLLTRLTEGQTFTSEMKFNQHLASFFPQGIITDPGLSKFFSERKSSGSQGSEISSLLMILKNFIYLALLQQATVNARSRNFSFIFRPTTSIDVAKATYQLEYFPLIIPDQLLPQLLTEPSTTPQTTKIHASLTDYLKRPLATDVAEIITTVIDTILSRYNAELLSKTLLPTLDVKAAATPQEAAQYKMVTAIANHLDQIIPPGKMVTYGYLCQSILHNPYIDFNLLL